MESIRQIAEAAPHDSIIGQLLQPPLDILMLEYYARLDAYRNSRDPAELTRAGRLYAEASAMWWEVRA